MGFYGGALCGCRKQSSATCLAWAHMCRYLATGSFDGRILVWSVTDGRLLRVCQGKTGIYEVNWSPKGDRVAACFAHCVVLIFDPRL